VASPVPDDDADDNGDSDNRDTADENPPHRNSPLHRPRKNAATGGAKSFGR
jgi:hypothetical protein